MGLDRELLLARVQQRRGRVGDCHRRNRDDLRHPPIRCIERQSRRRLSRQPVVVRRNRYAARGGLRQPHGVSVGDAVAHQRVAVALLHQNSWYIVVGHRDGQRLADGALARREVGRIAAATDTVRDQRQLLIFPQCVVDRSDCNRLRHVPIGWCEDQRCL